MKRILIGIILLMMVIGTSAASADKEEQQTVLIYMLACDLEKDSAAATEDLFEVMRVTEALDSGRIAVYIGGSKELWFPELENGRCYDLEFSGEREVTAADLGSVPSADCEALLRFLDTYACDGADLILWGHGDSETEAIGFDDLYDHDMLTLDEITDALMKSGVHYRLIGIDACGMATVNTARKIAPYAELFASSPEEETLEGWNYSEWIPFLMESNSSDELNHLIRYQRRNPDTDPITVLATGELLQCESELSRVLDSAVGSSTVKTVNEAALQCEDEAVRESVLRLLGGQTLLIGG